MLMQALVRTPDQHDPVTTRTPLLKSSLRTCLLVAGLQELATTPGNSFGPVRAADSARSQLTLQREREVRADREKQLRGNLYIHNTFC